MRADALEAYTAVPVGSDSIFLMRRFSEIKERYDREDIRSKADVDRFAENNQDIREELEISMQRALLRSRAEQMKSKPAENVSKCISLMMEIDSRMLGRMNTEDRENLKAELDQLGSVVEGFRKLL